MHVHEAKSPVKISSIYIYIYVTFLALLGAPYIYDISRLRVKVWQQALLISTTYTASGNACVCCFARVWYNPIKNFFIDARNKDLSIFLNPDVCVGFVHIPFQFSQRHVHWCQIRTSDTAISKYLLVGCVTFLLHCTSHHWEDHEHRLLVGKVCFAVKAYMWFTILNFKYYIRYL
jgi:hypothetical protein